MIERDIPSSGTSDAGHLSEEWPGVPTDLPRAMHQERFDELASLFSQGEFTAPTEDGGGVRHVVSYERHIDPLDRGDLAIVREFRLRAAALGMREAFSPLVLPTAATLRPGMTEAITSSQHPHRPLTFVQFGYEQSSRLGEAATGPPVQPRGRQQAR